MALSMSIAILKEDNGELVCLDVLLSVSKDLSGVVEDVVPLVQNGRFALCHRLCAFRDRQPA